MPGDGELGQDGHLHQSNPARQNWQFWLDTDRKGLFQWCDEAV